MASSVTTAGTGPVFHLEEEHAHAEGSSTMLGFWLYLMSDCLIFAMLFAAYGVLGGGNFPITLSWFFLILIAYIYGLNQQAKGADVAPKIEPPKSRRLSSQRPGGVLPAGA